MNNLQRKKLYQSKSGYPLLLPDDLVVLLILNMFSHLVSYYICLNHCNNTSIINKILKKLTEKLSNNTDETRKKQIQLL